RLDDTHPILSKPFREQGILALDMRFKNNGKDADIVLSTRDLLLELESGERVPALQQNKKDSLFGRSLYDSIVYETYGLPAEVVIKPGQERSGLVFFKVRDAYEKAKSGSITIQFSRVEVTKQVLQYNVRLP